MSRSLQKKLKILLCDDDPLTHATMREIIRGLFDNQIEIDSARNCDQALERLQSNHYRVMILDIQMRSEDEGLDYITRFKEVDTDIAIIVMSGRKDFEAVRTALRNGALDFIEKGSPVEQIELTLNRVREIRRLTLQNEVQNMEVHRTHQSQPLVGKSTSLARAIQLIRKARFQPFNILISGETGTGKELLARQARGQNSDGSWAPFVAIDSAAIQGSLAESTLFGHEKGAFTGATERKKGLFEEANGGIVYFDEIANMSLEIQSKLLRVLQEKEICRVGSHHPIPLNFRVISATNRDLEKLSQEGLFLDDLLQRINVIPVQIPALRERPEDIPELVEHFCQIHARGEKISLTSSAIDKLSEYHWPGNVRELNNLVAYLMTTADSNRIDSSDLPSKFHQEHSKEKTYYDRIAEFEREVLQTEYRNHRGNVSSMARSLGMDRSHLYTKLNTFGLGKRKISIRQLDPKKTWPMASQP